MLVLCAVVGSLPSGRAIGHQQGAKLMVLCQPYMLNESKLRMVFCIITGKQTILNTQIRGRKPHVQGEKIRTVNEHHHAEKLSTSEALVRH